MHVQMNIVYFMLHLLYIYIGHVIKYLFFFFIFWLKILALKRQYRFYRIALVELTIKIVHCLINFSSKETFSLTLVNDRYVSHCSWNVLGKRGYNSILSEIIESEKKKMAQVGLELIKKIWEKRISFFKRIKHRLKDAKCFFNER